MNYVLFIMIPIGILVILIEILLAYKLYISYFNMINKMNMRILKLEISLMKTEVMEKEKYEYNII